MWSYSNKADFITIVAYIIAIIIVIIIAWFSTSKSKMAEGPSYISPSEYGRVSAELNSAIGKKNMSLSDIHKKAIREDELRCIPSDKIRSLLSSDIGQLSALNGGPSEDVSLVDQMDMERQLWGGYDIETDVTSSSDAPQKMDYDAFMLSGVADHKVMENQRRWNNEVGPYSKGIRHLDNMNEVMETTSGFSVFRPSPVAQRSNAMYVTERDASHLSGNDKYGYNRQRNMSYGIDDDKLDKGENDSY